MEEEWMIKQGRLFYDREIGRYNFHYKDEGEEYDYGGIHCGEVFEVYLNDVWVPARMEMAGDWYLIGLPGLKLDGLMVRQRAG